MDLIGGMDEWTRRVVAGWMDLMMDRMDIE